MLFILFFFFFFSSFFPTSTTYIYSLSLHDALPISEALSPGSSQLPPPAAPPVAPAIAAVMESMARLRDRKSTRLNSSHVAISYAAFCLKKKTKTRQKINSDYMKNNLQRYI